MVVGAGALAGGALLWTQRDAVSKTATEPTAPPAAPATGATPAPETPTPHHWLWRTAADPDVRVAALALRSSPESPISWFVPLVMLPLEGDLTDPDGERLGARVVTYDLEAGFAVLTTAAEPAGVRTLEAAPSTVVRSATELTAVAVDGATLPPVRAETGAQGRIRLDRPLPAGAVLLSDGSAIGYVVRGAEAIPLDRALPWLGVAGARELAAAQRELREWMPEHLRGEIAELLENPAAPEDVRVALDKLDRVAMRTRSPEELDDLDRTRQQATLMLVRMLAESDPPAALATARDALARYPSEPRLLADTIVLNLNAGNASEAAQLFAQLQPLSVEHSERLAENVASTLRRTGERRVREQRFAEGLALLDEATRLFPRRADLHMARARALRSAGRSDEALAAAELAAGLDPALAREAARFRPAETQRSAGGRTVEIPLDPNTMSIRAEVRVGGIPAQLIVDTGASFTTIPSALAEQLGLLKPGLKTVRVATAGGEVQAQMVVIPYLTIGTIRVKRVDAVVLDLPGSLANKGLLGLNVLRRLNMQLDSENARLVLQQGRRRRR